MTFLIITSASISFDTPSRQWCRALLLGNDLTILIHLTLVLCLKNAACCFVGNAPMVFLISRFIIKYVADFMLVITNLSQPSYTIRDWDRQCKHWWSWKLVLGPLHEILKLESSSTCQASTFWCREGFGICIIEIL